jgi:outer membrane protein OmpA-like peptidoglycan-associated protein
VLEVRQIDAAGNVGEIATYAWTIATPHTAPPGETAPASAPDPASGPPRLELTGHVGTAGPDGGGSPLAVVDGGSLAVGCDIAGGTLRRCTVDVLVGGHKVGTGTATFGPGTPSGRVSVHLSRSLRTRLQRSNRPLKATFVFRATAAGGGKALVTRRNAVLVPTARWVLPTDGLFETDSAQLRPKVRAYLRAIAPLLRGAKTVRCEGHTDSRSSLAHNLRLGRARATAVCRALRRLHVRTRLVAVSRGESRPRATNSTQLGRWLNRRVELRVIR